MRPVNRFFIVVLIFGCFLLPGCKTTSPAKKSASQEELFKSFFKDPSTARWVKVEAAIKKRDLKSAIFQASQILVDHPDDPQGYILRGRAYSLQQDFGLALADFSEAIRLDPGNPEAYARRGFIYTGRKLDNSRALPDLDKAIELGMEVVTWDYEKAKGIMPVNLYHQRAVIYLRLGDNEAALENINKAIPITKKNPAKGGLWVDYLMRSQIYYGLGRHDEAAADARRALGLFPCLSNSYVTLGFVSLYKEDFTQAATYFDKAVSCLPNKKGQSYSDAQYGKAAVAWMQGQRTQAWDTLKTALQQSKGDAHVYFFLGYMAHENGDKGQAKAYFSRARELMPEVYGVRKKALSIDKGDKWTQLRKDQVRVAGYYYFPSGKKVAAPVKMQKASLKIQQVKVVPNPVTAGEPFDIETAYLATDPATSAKDLPLTYRFEIYQGQKKLFGSKALSFKGRNGEKKVWVQHMNPVSMKGVFKVKSYLKYKGREAKAEADFRIQ